MKIPMHMPPNLGKAFNQMNTIMNAYHEADGYRVYPDSSKIIERLEAKGLPFLQQYLSEPVKPDPKKPAVNKLTLTFDSDDNTVLHWVFRSVVEGSQGTNQEYYITPKDCLAMLEYMVTKYGKVINKKANFHGNLPMHLIAINPKSEPIELLIKNKISLKAINEKTGENLWHMIGNRNYDFKEDSKDLQKSFDLLIRAGVNLRWKDYMGRPARTVMMENKNKIVRECLKRAQYKEMMRGFVWLIWLQQKGKLDQGKCFNIGLMTHQCQFGILSFLIETV